MAKAKKKGLSVAEAINPETNKPDLLGALRFVVTKLNQEEGIQRGKLFHTLKGAFHDRVKRIGIPVTYLADFVLLIQDLGLARHRGASITTHWEVIDIKFFNDVVTPEWLKQSLNSLCQRHKSSTELRNLREKAKRPTGTKKESKPTDTPTGIVEKMAEMVAEVERLNGVAAGKDARIGELEAELESRPKVDSAAVADALVERFEKAKGKTS